MTACDVKRHYLRHAPGKGPYLTRLIDASRDRSLVSGLTHNFYRYPARFSPRFVQAAIEAFSDPNDLVFDPFMGGGTTIVEALALGRRALGTDISSLATFVSEVKTTLYSDDELARLGRWSQRVSASINIHEPLRLVSRFEGDDYQRNLDHKATWRFRKAIGQALGSAVRLNSPKLEAFARCVILKTSQWALDGRRNLPTIEEFRVMLAANVREMVEGARELRQKVYAATGATPPSVCCLNRSTHGLETDPMVAQMPRPQLIVTSPPYPGIHVLYHRWQVDGRKEAPAPFWIANKLDGDGAAYYTMGDRHARELKSYFNNLRLAFQSIASLCRADTTIIQMVAFSEPDWQLPRYLSVADDAGLQEQFLPELAEIGDGRLWRTVPNRKWHAVQKGNTHGSKEVVFFHRRAR